MINPEHPKLSIVRQCELVGLSRSTWYYERISKRAENLALKVLIDCIFTDAPYYGSRKMAEMLRRQGHPVNRKRVQRLMRGLPIDRPYQVWRADTTYIPIP